MSLRETGVVVAAFFLLWAPLAASAQSNDDVEAKVRAYFVDIPVMVPIAKCESEFTQFGTSGMPLHGGAGGAMVGVFQVHETVHADFAKERGMDIDTLDGNLAYARYLYEREGTQPWLSSFPCWSKLAPPSATNETVAGTDSKILNTDLNLGMEHPQVMTMQKLLNGAGFKLADSGPGSSGNETERFGALTRVAVRAFQCARNIVCVGDEYSTGYGFVGARTRAALLDTQKQVAASASTATSSSQYTPERESEIVRLEAQIAELTKILAALLQARGS